MVIHYLEKYLLHLPPQIMKKMILFPMDQWIHIQVGMFLMTVYYME